MWHTAQLKIQQSATTKGARGVRMNTDGIKNLSPKPDGRSARQAPRPPLASAPSSYTRPATPARPPSTTVAGISVEGMSRDQVISAVTARADAARFLSPSKERYHGLAQQAGISVDAENDRQRGHEDSTSLPSFIGALYSHDHCQPGTPSRNSRRDRRFHPDLRK